MFKKRITHTPENINYLQCMEKMRTNHPSRAHLFEDICRISSGIFPSASSYKFTDLWFNDPSVVESVFAAMRTPNLCFLHPIFINEHGIATVHQHFGRSTYTEQPLVPHIYKETQIDTCNAAHMAIPIMFNKHANILLITVASDNITVEHFEPHGPVHDAPISFNIEIVAQSLVSMLFNVPLSSIYYLPPAAVCFPHWIGPQSHVAKSARWSGTCTFWNMLYAFKRLLSPDTPPTTTFDEIKTFAEKMESNDDLINATIEAFMKLVNVDESNYLVENRRFIPEVRRTISNETRKRKGGYRRKRYTKRFV